MGAGVGGSYSAYRLGPTHQNKICVFERNSYVGGRAYDIDYDGNVPAAYSTTPTVAMGALRFYEVQAVIKKLADELQIPYVAYDYQTSLIKSRGQRYTSVNTMCSTSFLNLTCTDDTDGLNAADQLWFKLIEEYRKNPSYLYRFGDLNAFCRYLFGDEATEFLRESFRFRSDFQNVNAYSYMEFIDQDWNLAGTIYYPSQGMSQFAKRMIQTAVTSYQTNLYLNEEVLKIDENNGDSCYSFSIETSNYKIRAQQLIIAMNPSGWENVTGTVATEIKADKHFQAIEPVQVAVIESYWPRRWWEETSLSTTNIDRVWTKQNCISFMEISSQHPDRKEQNLTRTVYDDGLCVGLWSALIARSSQDDLKEEILRGLKSLFTDVQIPYPTKIFTKEWNGAWHFQKRNSAVSNKQIASWALNPLPRFTKDRLSLVGEAFFIDRSGWIDGGVKSSMISLTSQFSMKFDCFSNDAASGGQFCASSYV